MKPAKPQPAKKQPRSPAIDRLIFLCVADGRVGRDGGYAAKPWKEIEAQFRSLQQGDDHHAALLEMMAMSDYLKEQKQLQGSKQLWELAQTSLPLLQKELRAGWAK